VNNSSAIKAWVVAMLVTAFVAGGTTFLLLRGLVAQVPPPRTSNIEVFRKDFIDTFHLSTEQVAQMDRVLRDYEKEWDRVADEMYQKFRPRFSTLQTQAQKDIDAVLTPEQREVQQRERERRRRSADEEPPTNR
jgi:hypothetical protein